MGWVPETVGVWSLETWRPGERRFAECGGVLAVGIPGEKPRTTSGTTKWRKIAEHYHWTLFVLPSPSMRLLVTLLPTCCRRRCRRLGINYPQPRVATQALTCPAVSSLKSIRSTTRSTSHLTQSCPGYSEPIPTLVAHQCRCVSRQPNQLCASYVVLTDTWDSEMSVAGLPHCSDLACPP